MPAIESPPSDDTVYETAFKYWSSIKLDLNVVLDGYGHLHEVDIRDSKLFINSLVEAGYLPRQRRYALDCGSGLGRISKDLLLPSFAHVDMVDFSPTYIQEARKHIGEEAFVEGRVANCFVESLHTFVPPAGRYDVVWVQYVLGYLTDADLVAFLRRAADALVKPQEGSGGGGCIVVKEDVTREDDEESNNELCDFHEEDAWCVRPRSRLLQLFASTGMRVVAERKQSNFPDNYYPTYIYALQQAAEI